MKAARGFGACVAVLLSTIAVGAAHADEQDAARAEQMFGEGKAQMAAGNYAEACPLLQESYAAEPATGALLALALCYERAGKLDSAWRAYTAAAERSAAEQSTEREQAARSKAAELATQRSTLAVEVDGERVETLSATLDGVALDPGTLGVPFGVDGGTHVLELSAPGKQSVRVELKLRERGEARRVLVTMLRDVPAPAAASRTALKPVQAKRRWSAETWVGVGTAAAGVAALAVATGLAIRGANGNERAADAAGLCFALGGAMTATGLLVVLATRPSGDSRAARSAEVRANAWVSPSSVGVAATGQF